MSWIFGQKFKHKSFQRVTVVRSEDNVFVCEFSWERSGFLFGKREIQCLTGPGFFSENSLIYDYHEYIYDSYGDSEEGYYRGLTVYV